MVSGQMSGGGIAACLWVVLTLWVVTLSPGGVQACTPTDTEEPTLVQKVHNADVVIHGYVMETYDDGRFDYGSGTSVYTAKMLVYCMYKGPRGAVPMYINVTEAGYIPGHCVRTDLPKRTTAIVLLRRGHEDTLKPIGVALEASQENKDDIMKACNINVQYPSNATVKNYRDNEKCPTPVSDDECIVNEKGEDELFAAAGEPEDHEHVDDAHLPGDHSHEDHHSTDGDGHAHDHNHDGKHDHADHHLDHSHDEDNHEHHDHDAHDHDHDAHDHDAHDHHAHEHDAHDNDAHAHDPTHEHSHDHHHGDGEEADDHDHDHDHDGDHDDNDHHFGHEHDSDDKKDHKGTEGKDGKTDAVVGGGDNGGSSYHSSLLLSSLLSFLLTTAVMAVRAL